MAIELELFEKFYKFIAYLAVTLPHRISYSLSNIHATIENCSYLSNVTSSDNDSNDGVIGKFDFSITNKMQHCGLAKTNEFR